MWKNIAVQDAKSNRSKEYILFRELQSEVWRARVDVSKKDKMKPANNGFNVIF